MRKSTTGTSLHRSSSNSFFDLYFHGILFFFATCIVQFEWKIAFLHSILSFIYSINIVTVVDTTTCYGSSLHVVYLPLQWHGHQRPSPMVKIYSQLTRDYEYKGLTINVSCFMTILRQLYILFQNAIQLKLNIHGYLLVLQRPTRSISFAMKTK